MSQASYSAHRSAQLVDIGGHPIGHVTGERDTGGIPDDSDCLKLGDFVTMTAPFGKPGDAQIDLQRDT